MSLSREEGEAAALSRTPARSPALFARRALPAFGALALLVLAACTTTSLYGDSGATQTALALNYADPTNPLEQIVYQDLQSRFGAATNPGAPTVQVTVGQASRTLAASVTADPAKDMLMTVTGVVKITQNGQQLMTASRQATATYSSSGQVLGDQTAEQAAAEQAAHALADTLQLTISAALAPQAPQAS